MGRPIIIKELPSVEYMNELFMCDMGKGVLVWKSRPLESFGDTGSRTASHLHKLWNARFANKPAGSQRKDGYATVMIDGIHYKTHRVIWKMATGQEPKQIDHINRDQSDNRLANLRSVDPKINSRNRGMWANNTSGVTGVEFHSRDQVWTAKLGIHRRQVYLGSFKTKDEAIAARLAAEVTRDYFENRAS